MNKKGLSTVLTTVIVVAAVLIAVTISLVAFSQPVKNIKDNALEYIEEIFGGLFRGNNNMNQGQFDENDFPDELHGTVEDINTGLLQVPKMMQQIEDTLSGVSASSETEPFTTNSVKLADSTTEIEWDFPPVFLFNFTLFNNLQLPKEIQGFDLKFQKNSIIATIDWNVNGQTGSSSVEIPLKTYQEISVEWDMGSITVPNAGTVEPTLSATAALKGVASNFPIKGPGTYTINATVRLTGTNSEKIPAKLTIETTGDTTKVTAEGDVAVEVNIHP